FGEHISSKHFTNAVCVGAQPLNDIRKGLALLAQNMGGYRLINVSCFRLIEMSLSATPVIWCS
ncbi:hypothetical protein, partial [Sulfitobacter sp. 15WGC]|uniref:hypothetical protein n=1 Tax=Sulfitobacter sp. 15WGC TaxID=2575437 RepID=UPI001B7FD873